MWPTDGSGELKKAHAPPLFSVGAWQVLANWNVLINRGAGVASEPVVAVQRHWLRLVVLGISGLECIAVSGIIVAVFTESPAGPEALLSGQLDWATSAILVIYGLPALCLAAPAFVLAALNRNLRLALALSVLAILGTGLLFWTA